MPAATPCVLMDVMDLKKNKKEVLFVQLSREERYGFADRGDPKRERGRLRKIPDFYFEPILCEYCLFGYLIFVLSSVKSKVNV